MTTNKQTAANKANAKHSTGPKSIEGKQRVSANRITHGILSSRLLLNGENTEEYQELLDSLQNDLKPVGTMELLLVEKIAVVLWRQRRLVKAETASVTINMTPANIADNVGKAMGLSTYGNRALKPKDLEPPDPEQLEWCQKLIAEYEGAPKLNLDNLQKVAPLLFDQLTDDAKSDYETVEEHLEDYAGGLDEYASNLASWCRDELNKAERYQQILALKERAIDDLSVPWGKLTIINKYQASLDNQLYKSIKALREVQEWRLKLIEGELALESESGSEAA